MAGRIRRIRSGVFHSTVFFVCEQRLLRASTDEQCAARQGEGEDHFHRGMLTLRGLRKVSGKIFARLVISLGLGGIWRRRRRWRPAGTSSEQGHRGENKGESHRRSMNRRQGPPQSGGYNLDYHETCKQGNVFNLPRAGRQYEEQLLRNEFRGSDCEPGPFFLEAHP